MNEKDLMNFFESVKAIKNEFDSELNSSAHASAQQALGDSDSLSVASNRYNLSARAM